MKPRAVLLDFDGVVVASSSLHLEAWQGAVQEVFGTPLTDAATLAGHATRTIGGILAKRLGNQALASTLVRAKERLLAAALPRLALVPGARELLAALRERQVPHGIASNSPSAFVRGAIAATDLGVADVICGDEVSRGKPHPDIYWQLANRLRIDPRERAQVAVFEDSAHGLKAARAAGMIALGVATEKTPEDLRRAGAIAVCRDLADALAQGWLDELPT